MKIFILLLAVIFSACATAKMPKKQTDRERDGFAGKVANVYVSTVFPSKVRCGKDSSSYDVEGRLTKHNVYTKGCADEKIKINYTYSDDGKRMSSSNGVTGSPTTFNFDADGRLANEISAFNENESVQVNYLYDEKGRIIEKTYANNGTQYGKDVYEYEGENKAPSKFTYTNTKDNSSATITYTAYEFNSAGDWTKREETARATNSYIERSIEYYID